MRGDNNDEFHEPAEPEHEHQCAPAPALARALLQSTVETISPRDSRQRKRFRAGFTEIAALPYAIVCMHLGPSVEVTCSRGGRMRHGREVAGDLDIIPARTPSAWEAKQGGTTLVMRVPDVLLRAVASELDMDPGSIEIADRFQLRDPVIEHIAWAFKADIDAGSVGGRLFRESLGTALRGAAATATQPALAADARRRTAA